MGPEVLAAAESHAIAPSLTYLKALLDKLLLITKSYLQKPSPDGKLAAQLPKLYRNSRSLLTV